MRDPPPCSDLLGFSFGSRLPSRPPASPKMVTTSPASQPHTRWTGLGRASRALLLLSAPPSLWVSRAAETPWLMSLPPPGWSLRGGRGAAPCYLRRGPPRLRAAPRGAAPRWGKPFAGSGPGHGRQTERVQEKEVRRKGGGETWWQMLCQPHASPGTPSHALSVLPSPDRVRGSVPTSHAPGHAPGCGEARPDPPRRVWARDGEVGAAPRHHVSGRKRGGWGESFHSSRH